MKTRFLCLFLLIDIFNSKAQQVIPLYDNVPNNIESKIEEVYSSKGDKVYKVTKPTLTIYLPAKEKATGMGIIICPGGGYVGLSIKKAGTDFAEKLNEMGIAAFVLKYRLPSDSTMVHKEIGPLQDAQRAIQFVRENAVQYNIDTAMVGIMGSSAGGHLASTASTHFNKAYILNKKNTNLRPSFCVLVYPVISFSDKLAEKTTRISLIGYNPSSEQKELFSNELHVTDNTPSTFLVHALNDKIVSPLNSLVYFEALLKQGVQNCELHVYPKGNHGFGITLPNEAHWIDQLQIWLSLIRKSK